VALRAVANAGPWMARPGVNQEQKPRHGRPHQLLFS
jgi:hypothetical protein